MTLFIPVTFTALALLAGVVLIHAVAHRPRLFWRALAAVATATGGLITGGYTIFHEYLIGCIVVGQWNYRPAHPAPAPPGTRRHMLLFRLMCFYFAAESARGMVVLGSPQKVRWVVFYLTLAALSFVAARSSPLLSTGEATAEWLARAGLFYVCAYIAGGLLAETVFGISRYDLQPGHPFNDYSVWASSAYAVFPLALVLPAAIIACGSVKAGGRRLGWITILACIVAALYYDSRSGVFAICVYLVAGFRRLGLARATAILLFFAIVVGALMRLLWPSDRDLTAFIDDLASSGNALWNRDLTQGGGRDFYRAATIDAAFMSIASDPVHLLFGYGMRVSGFVVGGAVTEVYQRYLPGQTLVDPNLVGLEAFSDLVINTGLLGIGLLALNAWCVLRHIQRQRECPYRFLLAAAVAVVLAWLFVINIMDVPLFYIALMPNGLIVQLARTVRTRAASAARLVAPHGVATVDA